MNDRSTFKQTLLQAQQAMDDNQFAQAQALLKYALEQVRLIKQSKTAKLEGVRGDVASALVNLGASRERSRAIALDLPIGALNAMISEGFRRYRQR